MGRLLTLAVLLIPVGGCQGEGREATWVGRLEITNAFMAEPVTPEATAMYFTVTNNGPDSDTLLALSAPWAAIGEMHVQVSREGRVFMQPIESVGIPAGATIRFEPGALHGMLRELSRSPKHGEVVAVQLRFRDAGSVRLQVDVVPYAGVEERAAVGR